MTFTKLFSAILLGSVFVSNTFAPQNAHAFEPAGPLLGAELFAGSAMEPIGPWQTLADGPSASPKFTVSNADKHSGRSSLFVQFTGPAGGYPTLRTPQFTTRAGRTYRVSFWMKVTEGALSIRRRNGEDNDQRVLIGDFLHARQWTRYSVDYTERGKGGPGAYLAFFPLAPKTELYLDDISIREATTTPASIRAAWQARFPRHDFVCWQKPSPWTNLQALQYPPANVQESRKIAAAVGRDEYESLSFVVTNLRDRELKLNVSAPTGKIVTTLRQGMWVTAKNGSSLNDALPLLDGPLILPPGESREIWLTLKTTNTPPGTYKQKLTLAAEGGGSRVVELGVKVYPVVLPEDKPLYTCYWDNVVPSWTDAALAKEQMLDLKNHYTNVAVGHPWIVPPLRVDASGKLAEDYSELDAALKVYEDLNPKIILFNWNREAYFKRGDPRESTKALGPQPVYMSDEWKVAFRVWLKNWVAHMKARGYGYDRYAMYPDDENLSPAAAEMAKLIKETDPNVLFYVDHMGLNTDEVRAIAPYVDIYTPYLQEYENIPPYDAAPHKLEANRLLKKKPQYFWTYSNPTSLEPQEASPYNDYRLAVWRAWRAGMNGFGYYIYSYKSAWNSYDLEEWPTWSVVYFATADTSKKEMVVPGKRWEATREGVEDYVYLHMLRSATEKPAPGASPAAIKEGRKLLSELPARVLANTNNEALADRGKEDVLRALTKLQGFKS